MVQRLCSRLCRSLDYVLITTSPVYFNDKCNGNDRLGCLLLCAYTRVSLDIIYDVIHMFGCACAIEPPPPPPTPPLLDPGMGAAIDNSELGVPLN